MTTPQKKLVLILLVIIAWLAHAQFCEWSCEGRRGDVLTLGEISLDLETPHDYPHQRPVLLYLTLGVFFPVALVGVAGYLWIGWFSRRSVGPADPDVGSDTGPGSPAK
jgi:hypothetical protein